MAPLKTFRKHNTRSRASDDSVLSHDGAQSTTMQSYGLSAEPSNKLVVTNLHYEITPKDLTAIFGQVGTLVREPYIRYDRSGRSSGVAIITFETPAEATRSKKQLDGVLAKGQPISIEFDKGPSRRASAPAPSLLNRIQKPPLLHRLGQAQGNAKASLIQSRRLGPVRGRARPGRTGASTGTGRGRTSTVVPSAAELDSEIDAFMAVDNGSGTHPAKPVESGDVEMA
ncbi:hypothetical protein BGW80DRAFT_1225019 [Lactifluus volemus]|nr:hypothetical protein BGW80DRAFT_1225019 [Lactifluus volemus]